MFRYVEDQYLLYILGYQSSIKNIVINFINQNLQMPKPPLISRFLLNMDIFSTTEFFKIDKQSAYKTKTGGLITIFFIAIIVIILAVRIKDRQRGELLKHTSKTVFNNDQINFNTFSQGNNKFMMGVLIKTQDNHTGYGQEHFTVSMSTYTSEKINDTNNLVDSRIFFFQPCTEDHWNFTPQILSTYRRYHSKLKYMCLPNNISFSLAGLLQTNSDSLSVGILTITQCQQWMYDNPELSNASITCSSESKFLEELENNTQFNVEIIFSNSFINPAQINYKTNYIDYIDYFYFKRTSRGLMNWQVSKYEISTDRSYLAPIPQRQTIREEGPHFNIKPTIRHNQRIGENSDQLATINFSRSVQSLIIQRTDEKLIDIISYIGGLAATLFGIFQLIASKYSSFCFENDLNQTLFYRHKKDADKGLQFDQKQKQQNEIKIQPKQSQEQDKKSGFCSQSNFLTFLRSIFKCCSSDEDSKKDQKRLSDKLDISLIIQKLSIIEKIVIHQIESNSYDLASIKKYHETEIKSQKFDQILEIFYPGRFNDLGTKSQKIAESSENIRYEGLQIILNPIVNQSQMQQDYPFELMNPYLPSKSENQGDQNRGQQ